MTTKVDLAEPENWIGRHVRSGDYTAAFVFTVLAVDRTSYRPAAWIKHETKSGSRFYRSFDLCDLRDVETGEHGPTWVDGGGQ